MAKALKEALSGLGIRVQRYWVAQLSSKASYLRTYLSLLLDFAYPSAFILDQLVGSDNRLFLKHWEAVLNKIAAADVRDHQKTEADCASFVARHIAVLDPLSTAGHYTCAARALAEIEVVTSRRYSWPSLLKCT